MEIGALAAFACKIFVRIYIATRTSTGYMRHKGYERVREIMKPINITMLVGAGISWLWWASA